MSNETAPDMITHDCALFDFAIYTVLVGLLCILGLIGNIVSFTVLWKDTSKSATSFLLRALAVADSLVLCMAVPVYTLPAIYPYTGTLAAYYTMFPNMIPYLWPLYQIPYTGTVLMTVLVSLNRYFAVCRPFSSAKHCSTVQARKHVLYVAIFAIFYNIPRFFEYESHEVCVSYNTTELRFEPGGLFGDSLVYRIVYTNILYFLVMHGGPLLSLAFLNYKLIKALKARQKRRAEMGKGDYQQDITLVLVVVIFVFMFCQTPTFIDHILWTAVDAEMRTCGNWHYYYTALGDMMAVFNSSVNFLIYVLTSRSFRVLLKASCFSGESAFLLTKAVDRSQTPHLINKKVREEHV